MEEAGKHVRANEDATTLTDIARDMNHVPVKQKAEKSGSSSSRRLQEMTGSKSALEATCTLTGGGGEAERLNLGKGSP